MGILYHPPAMRRFPLSPAKKPSLYRSGIIAPKVAGKLRFLCRYAVSAYAAAFRVVPLSLRAQRCLVQMGCGLES